MNKFEKYSILFVLTVSILSGCAGFLSTGTNLEGTSWVLTHIQGDPVLDGTLPTLRFEGGQVSGSGSCNRFGGEYKQSGDQLTFGPLMSTLMACEPIEIMGQEQSYLAALGSAAKFNLQAGTLQIINSSGNIVLSFSAQDTSLEGKTWQMTAYNNGTGGLVSALVGSTVTAQFSDGTLSGSAGCNHYNASYTREGKTLSIEPGAITEMYCEQPAGVMEQESQYTNALALTTSCQVEGTQLTLLDRDGNIVVEFNLIP